MLKSHPCGPVVGTQALWGGCGRFTHLAAPHTPLKHTAWVPTTRAPVGPHAGSVRFQLFDLPNKHLQAFLLPKMVTKGVAFGGVGPQPARSRVHVA